MNQFKTEKIWKFLKGFKGSTYAYPPNMVTINLMIIGKACYAAMRFQPPKQRSSKNSLPRRRGISDQAYCMVVSTRVLNWRDSDAAAKRSLPGLKPSQRKHRSSDLEVL